MHAITACCLSLLLAVAITSASQGNENQPAEASPGTQQPQRLDRSFPVEMQYLLYLPADYESKPAWPLMLFLHGAGERGDDLERVKVHGPPKLVASGKAFPMIVASPQCPADKWWQSVRLSALLDDLTERYKVDEDRIYVTGLSMGGFGTWDLAAYEPERFAAILPICGGGETFRTRYFSKLPVWAFHGAKDEAVPLVRSQMMIDALKEHGGEPKLTVYPDVGHDSWTETYDNPEIYKWLLSQKREPKP